MRAVSLPPLTQPVSRPLVYFQLQAARRVMAVDDGRALGFGEEHLEFVPDLEAKRMVISYFADPREIELGRRH